MSGTIHLSYMRPIPVVVTETGKIGSQRLSLFPLSLPPSRGGADFATHRPRKNSNAPSSYQEPPRLHKTGLCKSYQ